MAYAYTLQKMGEQTKSMNIVNEAKDIAEKNGFKEITMKAHQHLASLYEAQNNYKQAYFHFKSFHALQDTLFNQQKDETINDLLVKYDSDKN